MMSEIKGELSFSLDGKKYTLKASHEALLDVDELLKVGVMDVFDKIKTKGFNIREMIGIIDAGLRANKDTRLVSNGSQELAKVLMKIGIPEMHNIVTSFCIMLYAGMREEGAVSSDDVGKL